MKKIKSVKSEVLDVESKGIVTIGISRFGNEDSYKDIVHKGAFEKTFKEGGDRIKHVIDHKLQQMFVVGLPLKMYETDTHAVIESKLNLEKQIAKDLFSDYKFFNENGKSLEHSFAYETIKGKAKSNGGENIYELKMYEYTTVALGANPETPLFGIKSEFSVSELENYLRKFDVSNQRGKQIERLIAEIKSLTEEPPSGTHSGKPISKLNKLLNEKRIFQ